jgi:hypothetical protein
MPTTAYHFELVAGVANALLAGIILTIVAIVAWGG